MGAWPGRALLGIGKQAADSAVGGPAGCGSNAEDLPFADVSDDHLVTVGRCTHDTDVPVEKHEDGWGSSPGSLPEPTSRSTRSSGTNAIPCPLRAVSTMTDVVWKVSCPPTRTRSS